MDNKNISGFQKQVQRRREINRQSTENFRAMKNDKYDIMMGI